MVSARRKRTGPAGTLLALLQVSMNRVTGTPSGLGTWLRRFGQRPATSEGGQSIGRGSASQVRPLPSPGRAPANSAERLALEQLTANGPASLGALVRAVAADLYRYERGHGGWAAEIGLVGGALFLRDAEHVIRNADGILWTIESSSPSAC